MLVVYSINQKKKKHQTTPYFQEIHIKLMSKQSNEREKIFLFKYNKKKDTKNNNPTTRHIIIAPILTKYIIFFLKNIIMNTKWISCESH